MLPEQSYPSHGLIHHLCVWLLNLYPRSGFSSKHQTCLSNYLPYISTLLSHRHFRFNCELIILPLKPALPLSYQSPFTMSLNLAFSVSLKSFHLFPFHLPQFRQSLPGMLVNALARLVVRLSSLGSYTPYSNWTQPCTGIQ